jgi:hypothetical protein
VAVAATLGTLALWWGGWTGPWPFLVAAALQGALALFYRVPVGRVDAAVEKAGQDLELLASVLERLEREWFQAPLLVRLRTELRTGEVPPSVAVRRLSRLVASSRAPVCVCGDGGGCLPAGRSPSHLATTGR